ncbi:hypothetical protein [Paraburkholderia haematera]|uniref:Uncharacterized protein n=1 Tax=Paraburkholderia haematera TaxID=2793077 RepID=A0ABN7M626_9BURK|nr:hypothetical protein [Paraburkholderia haematera]CAE6781714.1 hypothetical protein R69888_04333 [Paraburkholderia haematera]
MSNDQHEEALTSAPEGSCLSSGDAITQTLQDGHGISVRHGELIPCLFDPAYMPRLSIDANRGPNHA